MGIHVPHEMRSISYSDTGRNSRRLPDLHRASTLRPKRLNFVKKKALGRWTWQATAY